MIDEHSEAVARAARKAAEDERTKSPEQIRTEENERAAARVEHLGRILDGTCDALNRYGHERYQG